MQINKKRANEILLELESRFLDGERMSVEQILKEYINSTNTMQYLMGKETVKRWLSSLKNRFKNIHQVWFGSLNDLGQYGICETEAEYVYSLTRYFAFIKGNVVRAVNLKNEAQDKGMLLTGLKETQFLLPEPVKKEF